MLGPRASNKKELSLSPGLMGWGDRTVMGSEEGSQIDRDTFQELWPLVEECTNAET